jgi:hypothetical protein
MALWVIQDHCSIIVTSERKGDFDAVWCARAGSGAPLSRARRTRRCVNAHRRSSRRVPSATSMVPSGGIIPPGIVTLTAGRKISSSLEILHPVLWNWRPTCSEKRPLK